MGTTLIDITGQRFGMLTVLGRADGSAHWSAKWRCLCDCGRESVTYSHALRHGLTRSCGCGRGRLPDDYTAEELLSRPNEQLLESVNAGVLARALGISRSTAYLLKQSPWEYVDTDCEWNDESALKVRRALEGGRLVGV